MNETIKIAKNTITRKIELWLDEKDLEKRKQYRDILWSWNDKCPRIANSIVTHLYIQNNLTEMAYFNEEFKKNNPKIFQEGPKDPDKQIEFQNLKLKKDSGVITQEEEVIFKHLRKGWSPQSRTYKLVSETYKGDIPSDIYACINMQITSVFQSEKKEYFLKKRSLRTYKDGMPIPFSSKNIINIQAIEEEKDYSFTWFKIPFKTHFGRDASGNKTVFEMSLGKDMKLFTGVDVPVGAYKFCNSSIKIKGKKIFLLAVFQFDSEKHEFIKENVMEAHLSVTVPIALRFKAKTFAVGTRQEFLHQRLAIQGELRNRQIGARYANGGHGRKEKLKGIEIFHEKEKNFVITKHHLYSRKVIDYCCKYKCGVLILKYSHDISPPEELTSKERWKWYEENQPILRNWGYFGLTEKFKNKCKSKGIDLIIEEKETKPTE